MRDAECHLLGTYEVWIYSYDDITRFGEAFAQDAMEATDNSEYLDEAYWSYELD